MTTNTTPADFHKQIRQALKSWNNTDQEAHTLSALYLYRNVLRHEKLLPRQATNIVLKDGIDLLRGSYERDAELLEARFMDSTSIQNVANQYNVADSTLYVMQREAIDRLVDILELEERQASTDQKARLYQRLEAPTYENLLGTDALEEQLLEKISAVEPPSFLLLEGIGGIGKTSLAHKLMTSVIEKGIFSEVGWVSARQVHLNLGGAMEDVAEPALKAVMLVEQLVRQLMPDFATTAASTEKQLTELHALLKDSPHLIVVDNLETVADVEELLPVLKKLADPSRFILTSRIMPSARMSIFQVKVPELSEEDSLELIRQEARWSNLSELAEAPIEEIRPIFEAVGGNPLALRLIVGQNHCHPLQGILADVKTAKSATTQNLYSFIYRTAWHSLAPHCQQVLKNMLLANPRGDDIAYIADVSDMPVDAVRTGLNDLVRLNLVDARGGLNERRYSIHGLTRSFLHEEVIGWMSESNA